MNYNKNQQYKLDNLQQHLDQSMDWKCQQGIQKVQQFLEDNNDQQDKVQTLKLEYLLDFHEREVFLKSILLSNSNLDRNLLEEVQEILPNSIFQEDKLNNLLKQFDFLHC